MANADNGASPSGVGRKLEEMRTILSAFPRAFALVWRAGPALTTTLLLLNLVAAFIPVLTLWVTKLAIDHIALIVQHAEPDTPADLGPLWVLIGILGAVWVANRALQALTDMLSHVCRFQVEIYVQTLIMRKCADLDVVFFENPKNLDILEKATQGAMMSAWTLVWMLFSMARTMATLASFLVVLAQLHWLAMLVVAVTTAPQMVATSYFARRYWQMRTDLAEDSRLRFYLTWLMTQRDPAKEVRVFGLANYLLARFRFYWHKFYRQEIGLANRRELTEFFLGLLSCAGAVGVWVYLALQGVARAISLGDVVLYAQAVDNCQGNLVALFNQGGKLYEQTLFLSNLFALLDLKSTALEGALRGPEGDSRRWGTRPVPARIERGLEFRNVSFRYPGSPNWVLRHLSFCLRPGESVAVVGRNGAGKTTLVKLLVRLYDPSEGEILLEGHPLREYDLDSLRQQFAVIFQDYTRYWLTLRENVGFGDVPRVEDLEQVKRAAGQAGVEEIAQRLPREYETYLARQFMGLGEDLSGGEWQKVALARAYMRECPVLVLDEPTASLDAFAEYEVYKSFDALMVGRIVVFISHRFSTVRMAKHILVLENGALVEEGHHDALLERAGLYASMFQTQAERYR